MDQRRVSSPYSPVRQRMLAFWALVVIVLHGCLMTLGCAGTGQSGQEGREAYSQREVQIRLDLADAYLRNNEPRMSLRELLRIEHAAANSARFQFTLGYTQFLLENWTAAVEALQRTVALDPDHAEGWNNLGLAHLAEDDFTAAEFAFTRALEIPIYQTPEIPALNLALLYMERGDPVTARQYAEKAIALNWRFGRAYLLAGEIEAGQGNLDSAVDILRRGVEADMTNVGLMLTLAEYLLLAGRDQEAGRWLELVFEAAAPDSPEATTAEDYLLSLKSVAGDDRDAPVGREAPQTKDAVSSVGSQPDVFATAVPASPPAPPASPGLQPPDESPPASQAEPFAGTPPGYSLEDPSQSYPISASGRISEASVADVPADAIYIVQIGGFLDSTNADALRDDFAAKDYPAGTIEVTHVGYRWYLVYIDALSDLDAARQRAREFEQQEHVEAVVTRVGGGRYLPLDTP